MILVTNISSSLNFNYIWVADSIKSNTSKATEISFHTNVGKKHLLKSLPGVNY